MVVEREEKKGGENVKPYNWYLEEHLRRVRGLVGLLTKQKRRNEFNEYNIERLIEKFQQLDLRVKALEKEKSADDNSTADASSTGQG